ncbi:hypothetical protein Nmel_010812 [Mimus melanotis]
MRLIRKLDFDLKALESYLILFLYILESLNQGP